MRAALGMRFLEQLAAVEQSGQRIAPAEEFGAGQRSGKVFGQTPVLDEHARGTAQMLSRTRTVEADADDGQGHHPDHRRVAVRRVKQDQRARRRPETDEHPVARCGQGGERDCDQRDRHNHHNPYQRHGRDGCPGRLRP